MWLAAVLPDAKLGAWGLSVSLLFKGLSRAMSPDGGVRRRRRVVGLCFWSAGETRRGRWSGGRCGGAPTAGDGAREYLLRLTPRTTALPLP